MYLRYDRELWNGFLPATLFVCEFKHAQEAARVPFFVSNKLLTGSNGGEQLSRAPISFRDTRIVGPVPYLGDELGILVALFKVPSSDGRKALLSIIEKVLGVVGYGSLAQYVAMADKLGDEVFACLNVGQVDCLLAERRVYGGGRGATVPLTDGYLALVNCPEGEFRQDALRVVDGRLCELRSGRPEPISQYDHCLMRIEGLESRDDYASLPFHKTWEKARKYLLGGKSGEAGAALLDCMQAILDCEELTESDKNALVQTYVANFERDKSLFATLGSLREPAADRDGRPAEKLSGPSRMGRLRARAQQRRAPKEGIQVLGEIEKTWPQIMPPQSRDRVSFDQDQLDSAELTRQITLRKQSADVIGDPRALVHAIASAMLDE
jgi:hypothetical protein